MQYRKYEAAQLASQFLEFWALLDGDVLRSALG